jgi:hypothetical protein
MINELHDAADRAESLRRLGEWKDVHFRGRGTGLLGRLNLAKAMDPTRRPPAPIVPRRVGCLTS